MISLQQNAPEWGEWIEWKGGDCPIPDAMKGEWECLLRCGEVPDYPWLDAADAYGWEPLTNGGAGNDFVAYRTLKSAQPTKDVTGEWYPPQQEGFGPWIDCSGLEAPVAPGEMCQVLALYERQRKNYTARENRAECWWHPHRTDEDVLVAYCIKLDPPAKSEEPTRHAKIRVMEPAVLTRPGMKFVCAIPSDLHTTEDDLRMCIRDEQGAKPTRIRPNIPGTPADLAAILAMCDHLDRMGRDEDFALATMVDPVFDHRFGRWGAR